MRDEALHKIRIAKTRRLEVLEEQIAIKGYDAEPELVTERDELRIQLGIVNAVANSGIDEETRRILRRYDQADLNINVLSNVVQRLTAVEEWIGVAPVIAARREFWRNLWLGALTVLLLALLLARVL